VIKKYILQDNACEAWGMAIKYCDDIMAGKITLLYRKYFVESLHNAVELFIKQLMLNQNDYRVAKIRQHSKDGEPIKSYLSATDLNSYFGGLDTETSTKFYSIEFSEIIEQHRKILHEYFLKNTSQNITDQLKLLQRLRNDETHFYIEKSTFLSEKEFQQLYNFMVVFYDILHEYNLLPYWGKPMDEHKGLSFDRIALTSCSYIKLLIQSPYVKKLIKLINGVPYYGAYVTSAYSIAEYLINTVNELKDDDFHNLYVYIETLYDYGKLTFNGVNNEYTDEYDQKHSDLVLYIVVKK